MTDLLLDPEQFKQAIRNNDYEIVKYNLMALVEDSEYRNKHYKADDFKQALSISFDHQHWDILLLLFAYAPKMGIKLTDVSPFAWVKQWQKNWNEYTAYEVANLSLSTSQKRQLKEFDAEQYRLQHDIMADKKNSEVNLDTLVKAINDQDLNAVKQCILTIQPEQFDFRKFPPSFGKFYSLLIQCIEQKNIEMLLFLYAWLPQFGYVLPESGPYEFYKSRLNDIRDREIILSKQVEDKLRQLDPDTFQDLQLESSKELKNTKTPRFIDGLDKRIFKSSEQAAKAFVGFVKSTRDALSKIVYPDIKIQYPSTLIKELREGDWYLRKLFGPYLKSEQNITVKIDKALEQLFDAVCWDNGEVAKKAFDLLIKKTNLSVGQILYYMKPNYGTIIRRIFLGEGNNYQVIKTLCFESLAKDEILQCFQEYIKKKGIGQNKLYFLLVTNPPKAYEYLLSEEYLQQIVKNEFHRLYHFDTYRFNTDLYYKGNDLIHIFDIVLEQVLSAPRTGRVFADLNLRYNLALFVRDNVPNSRLLQQLFLPLNMRTFETLRSELSLMPEHHEKRLQSLVDKSGGIQYIIDAADTKVFPFKEQGKSFNINLTPLGLITITPQQATTKELKQSKIKSKSATKKAKKMEKLGHAEQTIAEFDYSGNTLKLKKSRGNPEFQSNLASRLSFFGSEKKNIHGPKNLKQTPNILADNRNIPVSLSGEIKEGSSSNTGFWGEFDIFGDTKDSNKEMNSKMEYQSVVTAACMVGVTFVAQVQDINGHIKTISLTHPGAEDEIEQGSKIISMSCEFKPHLYEKYTMAQLREDMTFIKGVMKPGGKLIHDLPTSNYINYGIRYYLQGLFNRKQLIEYIQTIREHDEWYRKEFAKLAAEFDIEIITFSTLDSLGFARDSNPEKIVDFIDEQMKDMQEATNQEKENKLASCFIETLKKEKGHVGEIYRNLPESTIKQEIYDDAKPLLALNYLDYQAILAWAKLESAQEEGKPKPEEVLLFYPKEESHIPEKAAVNFKDYGPYHAVTWIPTIIPQKTDDKTKSKMFYSNDGVTTMNTLVDQGLVHLQGLMAYAISNNNPELYIYTKNLIEEMLLKLGSPDDDQIGLANLKL